MDYFGSHGHARHSVPGGERPRTLREPSCVIYKGLDWFYVLRIAVITKQGILFYWGIIQSWQQLTWPVLPSSCTFHPQVLFPAKERDRRMDGGMATLVSCSCCVCCVKSAFFYWKRIALRFYCLHITLKLRFILRENRCGSASHYCDWFFGRQARGCARSITRSPCSLLTLSQRVKNNHPRFSPAARQRRLFLFWVSISFPDFNRL